MADQLQLTLRRGPGPGLIFNLAGQEIRIGRGADNEISIVNLDVSRFHAKLNRNDAGGYLIEDLNSSNGTFVNERQIGQPVELKLGDVVRLGAEVELVLGLREEEGSTRTFSRSRLLSGISESDTKKTHVFISYSRKDIEFVKKLHNDLTDHDFKAWVDWEGIPLSADWWEEIVDAISSADAFIFVISPGSLKSEVCERELNKAIELNKNVVPILFIDPDKQDKMNERLSSANWVYMRNDGEYLQNFPEMAATLTTDLEWVKEHTRLLVRAVEWTDSGKKTSTLLRGDDLSRAENFIAESHQYKLKLTPKHIEYIQESRRFETTRQRRSQVIGIAVLIVLSVLLVISVRQTGRATTEAINAENAANTSDANAVLAENNRATAVENQNIAGTQRVIAQIESNRALTQEARAIAGEATAIAALDVAEVERQKAVEQATRARASQLAAQAQQLLLTNAPLATVLAIESLTANPLNREALDLLAHLPYFYPPINRFFSGHNSPVTAIDWSKAGKLASGSENGDVFIWDLESHFPAIVKDAHTGTVTAVSWGPNGEIASASTDGTIYIWQFPYEQVDLVHDFEEGPLLSLDWSDNGVLAIGGSNGKIHRWISTLRIFDEPLSHAAQINVVKWNGFDQLASGSSNHTVKLWNFTARTEKILSWHTDAVRSLAWGPAQQLATGSNDSTIILWDIISGRPIRIIQEHTGPVLGLDWIAENRLVSSSTDSKIFVLDPRTGLVDEELKGHTGSIHSVIWGEPGHIFSGGEDESIAHWQLVFQAPVLNGHLDRIRSVAWSSDGSQFASASDDNTVILWDMVTGRVRTVLREHRDRVNQLDWSPRNILATVSDDSRVIVWDLPRPQSRLILSNHEAPVKAIRWSQQGRLASGDENGTVIIWDLDFAVPQFVLMGHAGAVNALAWSPNGLLASAGDDNTIMVKDLEQQTPPTILAGHTDSVLQIAWNEDGLLASASADGTVIIWFMQEGVPAMTLTGHQAPVNTLAWDQEGRLISGSDDQTIIYWDLENGSPYRIFRGHEEEVTTVAWRPDGAFFASGSSDNQIRILYEKFLNDPCSWGVRNINSGDEWDFYFPDQEYHETCEIN